MIRHVRPVELAALVFISILSLPTASAQQGQDVAPGARVRVEHQGGIVTGTLAGFASDGVVLIDDADSGRIVLPIAHVTSMAVRRRALWTRGATIGAAIGTVAGGLIGYAGGHGTPDRTTYTLLGAAGGSVAGAAVARGPRARGTALLALGAGTAIGTPIFGPACEESESISCSLLMGLVFLGTPAFALGSGVGLLLGDEHWQLISADRLQVSLVPLRSGALGAGLAVRF